MNQTNRRLHLITLQDELFNILIHYVGKAGEHEGAVEVLTRLIRERDSARAELKSIYEPISHLIES